MLSPLNRSCEICQEPLTVHQAATGTVCGSVACRNEFVREQQAQELRRQTRLNEQAAEIRSTVAERQENDQFHLAVLAVIPVNQRKMVNVPTRSRTAFRDRLLEIIGKVTARRWKNDAEPPGRGNDDYRFPEVVEPRDVEIVIQCCSTCSGHCCPQGGNHAFIHEETIWRYMDAHPDHRPQQILDAYLSQIGQRHFEESCVYHGPQGCRLPREMRSYICNEFLCRGLSRALAADDECKQQGCVVVAAEEDEVIRTSVTDSAGQKVVVESTTPATAGTIQDA